MSELRVLTAPIVRVDAKNRMVEAIATSEAVDSFKTRFLYAASCDAFARAFGNVREMHQLIAAGRMVKWQGDPTNKLVRVWIKVSLGAESTWQKILDGTLSGLSIGADPKEWEEGADGIRTYTRYDLVELSFVDQPSNPDALVTQIRVWRSGDMANKTNRVLANDDDGDEPGSETAIAEGDASKVKPGQDAWHDIRDTSLHAAKAAMTNCGCDDCADMADQMDARTPAATRGRKLNQNALLLAQMQRALTQSQAALLRSLDNRFARLDDIDARLALIEAQPLTAGPLPLETRSTIVADQGRFAQPQASRAAQIAALQEAAKGADIHGQTAIAAQIMELKRAEQLAR